MTGVHRDKVRGYVDTGVAEGAQLVVDGRGLNIAGHEDGFFLGGCLFDRVTPGMTIYREEIFGPVLCVVRVPDFNAAVELVNGHEYGNGSAIFTRDGDSARQYVQQVEAPRPESEGQHSVVEFGSLRLADDRPVRSGGICELAVELTILDTLRDSVEPLQIRVRSLHTGRIIFLSGSRRLDVSLDSPGSYAVRVELQANVAPGNYLVEVSAHDALTQKDIAFAPSVAMQVVDAGTFRGSVQMNPQIAVLARR